MREDAILWEVEPEGAGPFRGGSLTVMPWRIGIVIRDGEVVDVFESGKRDLSMGNVRTYVASASAFTLTFWLKDPEDTQEPEEGTVLDQDLPVLTSDGEVVTGRIDLTLRVTRKNVEYLFQLLRQGSGVVMRRDVSDAIKGELLAKVLALDIHKHTAKELRGNRDLFGGIYESVNVELASTIRVYGLRLDNFTVMWGLTREEQEELRKQRHPGTPVVQEPPVPPQPPVVDSPTPVTVQSPIPTPVGPPTQPPTRTRVGPPPNTPPSLPEKYRAFFQPLVDTLRKKYPWFTGATKGGSKNWKAFSATPSLSGSVSYRVVFDVSRQVMVNIYIERNEDTEWNKWLFDQLMERKDSIESKLGSLFWDRMEGDMACRIAVYRPGTIYEAEETLKEIREWAIEHLLAFDRVFGPELERLLKLGTRRRPVNRR